MLRILAIIAPSIAASMSASSNTMNGALPPSSIAGLTTLSAPPCRGLRPATVEAGAERGAGLARPHRGREIPRRHQARDARRLVLHHHAGARGRRARHLADG